ncbi:MAG: site-2 protease family protein [Janthinobacterium lividum]
MITAWLCLQIYGLYLALVAVHEAGHHLAGAFVGYRWQGTSIGPLKVFRETLKGPVRVKFSMALFGGLAFSFGHLNDTRSRQAMLTAGGPLASLLFGAGMLLYFLHLSPQQQDKALLVIAMVVMSAALVLGSVIPYSPRGVKNDAALLVELWKDKARWEDFYASRKQRHADYEREVERFEALTTLSAAVKNGPRPREWDGRLVEIANAFRDGKMNEAVAAHYGFYWAADRADWEESGRYLGRALALRETLPALFGAMVLLDGAYYAGLFQNDAVAARLLLTEASAISISDSSEQAALLPMTLRAEGAALRAEGRLAEAAEKGRQALDALAFVTMYDDCADRFLIERLMNFDFD